MFTTNVGNTSRASDLIIFNKSYARIDITENTLLWSISETVHKCKTLCSIFLDVRIKTKHSHFKSILRRYLTRILKNKIGFFLDVIKILTLAALISSSAKHSAIVLMLRKAASRAPVHNSQIA